MLDFHYPEIADKIWADRCLSVSQYMGCEYSFGNIFMWSFVFKTKIAYYKNCLITKGTGKNPSYCCPAGSADFKTIINALMEDAEQCGHPFKMFGLSRDCALMMEEQFPNQFDFTPYRDGFDYIYLTNDLINLEGKKYHSKRNHIAAFERSYKHSLEMISEKNIDECIKMNAAWVEENKDKDSESIAMEQKALNRGFEHYFELGFSGAIIRADEKPVAFTIGERLNDITFCTHFEKAFADVRGAYPIINREFAKAALRGYKYVNREDDTGSDGLRKAKMSYYPAIIFEKYKVSRRGEI